MAKAVKLDCDACLVGKATTKSVSKAPSTTILTRVGEIVASDTCGPFPPSRSGKIYTRAFIDLHSDYCILRYHDNKRAQGAVEDFQFVNALIKSVAGKGVKIFRADRGTEFVNGSMSSVLDQCGTQFQSSTPHKHGQNGHPERRFRITLLTYSQREPSLWAEAFNFLNYVRNHLRRISGRVEILGRTGRFSPAEIFYNQKVHVTPFHPFGCLALAVVPPALRTKFGPRVHPCILLGFQLGVKGAYRLLNLDTNRLIIRSDVHFRDDSFPGRQAGPPRILRPRDDDEQKRDHNSDPTFAQSSLQFPLGEEPQVPLVPLVPAPLVPPAPLELAPVPQEPLEPMEPAPPRRSSTRARKQRSIFSPGEFDAQHRHDHASVATDAPPSAPTSTRSRTRESVPSTPSTYSEAIRSDDAEKWQAAMQEELHSHKTNQTWETVVPPLVIGCKWVFKVNVGRDHRIRFQACVVAKGYTQVA